MNPGGQPGTGYSSMPGQNGQGNGYGLGQGNGFGLGSTLGSLTNGLLGRGGVLAAPLATIMWLETKLRSNTTALEASREELAEVVRLDERTRPTILATVLDLDAFRANNPVEQAEVAEGHVAPVVHADFRRMPTYRQLRAHA